MALLGVLIDKQTMSRAGTAVTGVVLLTYAHSLPATNPELLLPVVRSIEAVGGNTAYAVNVCGLGGNASLSTVAVMAASCVSTPITLFDLYAIVFHSIIR